MSTLASIEREADRVMDAVSEMRGSARLLGGLAVRAHLDEDPPEALARRYADIDVVCDRRDGKATLALLTQLGYQPNDRFNAMNAGTRLLLYDTAHERRVDVFVGGFRMCHQIPLDGRLDVDRRAVPLAELILTKLQIVALNRKDVQDVLALMREHEVGKGDVETINADRIASLLGADWGLWRTAKSSIETIRHELAGIPLSKLERRQIETRLDRLWARVEAGPRTLRWRSRAKIGERMRWYEEPEEVRRAEPT